MNIITTNRKSFIIHNDSLDILDQLTDQQAGKLFKAISCYQKTGQISQDDQLVKIAIVPFINQFKRDEEKYLNIVERNKINISKRWSKNTTGRTGIPKDTKNTDSDSDSKNKKDNKNELPIFINENLFDDFAEMRKKLKKPLTEKAKELLIKKLSEFESSQNGFANKALENSIENSWQGVFEPKQNQSSFSTKPTIIQDSFCQSLNQSLGQDLIKSLVEGEVITIKLTSASANDKWDSLSLELKNQILEKVKAKFGKNTKVSF